MAEIGLYLAALVGIVSLCLRNWTAIPLLASFAVVTLLCRYEVDFNALYWTAIDVIAFVSIIVIAVLRDRLRYADFAILALFVPAFVAPLFEADVRNAILWAVTVTQFLLTFPLRSAGLPLLRSWARFNREYDPWRDADLRVLAE